MIERLERWLNPVVFKDLLAAANSQTGTGGRAVLYGMLFAVPLLGLCWAIAFAHGPWRFAGRPVLLLVCALLGLFHIAVAVPAATAFALERDRSTLESLVISPLSPWRLVLGKLLTALSVGAMSKAAALPALGLAFALGGADLAFVPRFLILLLAVDVSLAAFALHLGARRREINTRVGWVKAQTSQTQLVMQTTIGLTVATSLVPIYLGIFLVPVALQQGIRLPEVLADLAPLGALHPLAALVLWGDANLLGARVPVWVCGVVFHLLLALPMLADSAEAQKTPGSPRGRLTRLLALPVILFSFVLVASVATNLDLPSRALVATLLPAFVVIGAAGRCSFSHSPLQTITPKRILRGLLPTLAVESAPERAAGFTLIVVLLASPLLFWGGGSGPAALSSVAAVALVGLSLAALGTRGTARKADKEDQAFIKALESHKDAKAEEEDGNFGKKDKPQQPLRLSIYVWFLSLLVGGGGLLALALAQNGAVPALRPLEPVWTVLASAGLALNPMTALLPILTDATAFGSDAIAQWFAGWGLDTELLFFLHVGIYSLMGAASILSLKTPMDLNEVMAERKPPEDEADVKAEAEAEAEAEPEATP